jgi:hypothetical protein
MWCSGRDPEVGGQEENVAMTKGIEGLEIRKRTY